MTYPDPDSIKVYGSLNSGGHRWTWREYSAIQALARDVVARAFENAKDEGIPGWEDYPELAGFDWTFVMQEAEMLVPEIDTEAREQAVAVLAPRAERGC